MKILLINTYFFMFGGAERYFFDLAKLFEEHGHEVMFFCMDHPKNLPTKYSKYFVSYFPPFNELSFFKKIKFLLSFFYNFEAKKKFRKLILEEKPDLVHINIISFEITHSIIFEAKRHKIPIIMTLHDYRILCPQVVMLNKGKICEKCINGSFFFCIKNKCIFGSLLRSIPMTIFYYFNFFILKTLNKINLFISPSQYLKYKIKKSRYCSNFNIVVMEHFIDVEKYKPKYDFVEKNVVYFGRLSKEKGIDVLIDAIKDLDVTLKIIGAGDFEFQLQKKVLTEQIKNVYFLGFLNQEDLYQELKNSMFSVAPSLWEETFGYSIAESFCVGKPVIASEIGAYKELINDSGAGLLFSPGDVIQLKEKIRYLIENIGLCIEMGKNARRYIERKMDKESYHSSLVKEYNNVLQKHY